METESSENASQYFFVTPKVSSLLVCMYVCSCVHKLSYNYNVTIIASANSIVEGDMDTDDDKETSRKTKMLVVWY